MLPSVDEHGVLVLKDDEWGITMGNTPIISHTAKHVFVKYLLIYQIVQRCKIEIVHIGTEVQHKDPCTKALDATRLMGHAKAAMNAVCSFC